MGERWHSEELKHELILEMPALVEPVPQRRRHRGVHRQIGHRGIFDDGKWRYQDPSAHSYRHGGEQRVHRSSESPSRNPVQEARRHKPLRQDCPTAGETLRARGGSVAHRETDFSKTPMSWHPRVSCDRLR